MDHVSRQAHEPHESGKLRRLASRKSEVNRTGHPGSEPEGVNLGKYKHYFLILKSEKDWRITGGPGCMEITQS
jgi:hypothetical protein